MAAQALYDAANTGAVFDLTDVNTATQVQADLTSLVADDVLVPADITAVLAIGITEVTQAAALGWPGGVFIEDLTAVGIV